MENANRDLKRGLKKLVSDSNNIGFNRATLIKPDKNYKIS